MHKLYKKRQEKLREKQKNKKKKLSQEAKNEIHLTTTLLTWEMVENYIVPHPEFMTLIN